MLINFIFTTWLTGQNVKIHHHHLSKNILRESIPYIHRMRHHLFSQSKNAILKSANNIKRKSFSDPSNTSYQECKFAFFGWRRFGSEWAISGISFIPSTACLVTWLRKHTYIDIYVHTYIHTYTERMRAEKKKSGCKKREGK